MSRANICSEITEDLIPDGGTIVFDWDNTLKVYNHSNKQISSRVDRSTLQRWKHEKQCKMYVISAIRPSRINLETLLFEVRKLGLLEIFAKEEDKVEVKAGKYARMGNVIICGYDKAETFLEIARTEPNARQFLEKSTIYSQGMDVTDAASDFMHDSYELVESDTNSRNEDIIFFDDEEVNIINFSALIENSTCFLVK